MITVKNSATGETIIVNNANQQDGVILAHWKSPAPKADGKFFASHPYFIYTDEFVNYASKNIECRVIELADGWEMVTGKGERKQRQQKADVVVKKENDEKESEKVEPVVVNNNNESANSDAEQLAEILARMKGGNIDEAKVEDIVRRVLAEKQPPVADVLEVRQIENGKIARINNPHPLFKKVLALVVNDRVTGRYPWLFGDAGSGKSTIAKQVADALGLPFYSVSSLQQKYELEGYTDATGKLVETVFYKAAKEGGIFLFDEASTTSAEVQVAFNSMLANLWYNFPKEGMINAHPDFHIIAADNTTGRGGNSTYSARFQMDASTLDRYTAIRVEYTDELDMAMAENDTDLVAFIRDLRNAINDARLSYTASPRALRAIKAHQKMDVFTELEAFELGLCSSWNKQDIRTLSARIEGDNKYYKMFNELAK